MGTRIQLHEKLLALFGSNHVYFQPPPTIKMNYPAIVYNLDGIYERPANNKVYVAEKRYTVTFIHKDPDKNYSEDMYNAFSMCSFDRRFVSDNLYHDVYTLYY